MHKSTHNKLIYITVSAMYAALLVGTKQLFALIPNVETVTLLIALCAYCWGLAIALPAVNVFICVDTAIWGFGTWVFSYVVHWNAVALCFWALSKLRPSGKLAQTAAATALAVVVTMLFGVQTTVIDTLIGWTGNGLYWDAEQFGARFAAMYVSGVGYYAVQVVSNLALFAVAFLPLERLNAKARLRLTGDEINRK